MKRYVLRFRGTGEKPAEDVARIRTIPNIKVLDETSGRMMLVEASEENLSDLMRSLPQWISSEEQIVPLPDTRKKVS